MAANSKTLALNVERTIDAPVERVWQAWADPAELSHWFTTHHHHLFEEKGAYQNGDGDKGVYTEIVPNQRLKFTWENETDCPGTSVRIEFRREGAYKTSVALTHENLADVAAVDNMREGWTWALESWKSYSETGIPIKFKDWRAGSKAKG
ncbi:MAG: hypothetical protein QOJ65_941 [Fimbriimonadaceae bacterium]|nr:hypothetical protein [Fimbriimonadaceae bacterium]